MLHRLCAKAALLGCMALAFVAATMVEIENARAADGESKHWFAQFEVFGSLYGNIGDRDLNGTSFGPGVKLGHRWDHWGLFVTLEQNAWVIDEGSGGELQPGVLNVGVGGELIYFDRRLRASLALGPSILLYGSTLDAAGTTGLFVDLRPAGIRWPLNDALVLMVDPISFFLAGPVLTGIPLILVEFRTTVGIEYRW